MVDSSIPNLAQAIPQERVEVHQNLLEIDSNIPDNNLITMNNSNSNQGPLPGNLNLNQPSLSENVNFPINRNVNFPPHPSNVDNILTGPGSSGARQEDMENNSYDSLITFMQRTLRATQEEFRRELSSVRDSISQIGNGARSSGQIRFQSSNLNLPPSINLNNRNTLNADNSNAHNSSFGSNVSENIKLEKWKISYDGTTSVSEFLFKIETLSNRTRCSDEHLLSNFHIFLTGKAECWYWLYMQQNRHGRRVTYDALKTALTKEYGYLESDHEVLLRISARKQHFKESYDDFHASVLSMNCRLREPFPERTLIEIMKRNLLPNLKVLLFNSDPGTLDELKEIARKAERVIRDNKFQPNPGFQNRTVNEIEASLCDNSDSEEIDPQLEAIDFSKRLKPDYSRIQCWNCLAYGHSYIYCPEEIQTKFCFKCGNKGVLTPKCPNRHQGNRKVSEMATGDTRSTPQTPSLN